jgi:hypothetical protein
MPEISRFFGIIITIYMEVEEVHQILIFMRAMVSIRHRSVLIQSSSLPERYRDVNNDWLRRGQNYTRMS